MLKTYTKKFLEQIRTGDLSAARETFSLLQKRLDQVAAKGTLHRKTAARRKSRLAARLNKAISASA